ncbi:hypothetical protein [Paraburkholderia atlantica]|uniref:hypothetical protein n=1 Tax=Paraburkholderia atlantica TaxID=2654982 RepID=UPI003D202F4B
MLENSFLNYCFYVVFLKVFLFSHRFRWRAWKHRALEGTNDLTFLRNTAGGAGTAAQNLSTG